MNTKTTAPHPSQGELAEQRHLVDPLDHVLEHLADERPTAPRDDMRTSLEATFARLQSEREAKEATQLAADSVQTDNVIVLRERATRHAYQAVDEYWGAFGDIQTRLDERVITPLLQVVTRLSAEVDRLRAELAALPAPTVEHGFRDADGQAWPTKGLPARTAELISNTNFRLQRTVRYGEWTEVTA